MSFLSFSLSNKGNMLICVAFEELNRGITKDWTWHDHQIRTCLVDFLIPAEKTFLSVFGCSPRLSEFRSNHGLRPKAAYSNRKATVVFLRFFHIINFFEGNIYVSLNAYGSVSTCLWLCFHCSCDQVLNFVKTFFHHALHHSHEHNWVNKSMLCRLSVSWKARVWSECGWQLWFQS